jgi:uncharacterized membrane protein YccC
MTGPRLGLLGALFQIEPGKPALGAGLRMTVTVVLPAAAGIAVGDLAAGLMIAIGALNVGLTDDGSPYRRRLFRMTMANGLIAATILVATVAGRRTWLAALLMLVWAFACGLTNLFSSGAATIGMVTLVVCAIGIGLPGDWPVATARFLQFLAGGALAIVLSTALWPLHPWRPIERAVAAVYRALARAIPICFDRSVPTGPDTVAGPAAEAIDALVAGRAGRRGPTPIAEHLLFLVRTAERADEALAAVRESLSSPELRALDSGPDWAAALAATAAAMAGAAGALAGAVEAGGGDVDLAPLETALADLSVRLDAIRARATTAEAVAAMTAHAETTRLLAILDRLLQDAAASCRALAARRRILPPADAPLPLAAPSPLIVLRGNLTLRSAGLRHALRIAVTTAAAAVIGPLADLGHAYWVTLTVVVILKPTYGATMARGLQRVVGSVLGALLAALLVSVVTSATGMLAVLAVSTTLTFTLLPLNYGLYTLFLTPVIVLLLDLGQPGTFSVALDRALDSMIGGALAFLGGYLLWPTSERLRLTETLAAAAEALRTFVAAALGVYLGASDPDRLRSAGAGATLAVANADAALQRLVTEPARRRGDVTVAFAFVAAVRRLYSETSALAVHAPGLKGATRLEGLDDLAGQLDAALCAVSEALRGALVPPPLPRFDSPLRRMSADLTALHTRRAAELSARQMRTPTREVVADVSLAAREVMRMAADVESLHRAAGRLAGVASPGG